MKHNYRLETTLTYFHSSAAANAKSNATGGFIIKINRVIRSELMEINNATRYLFPGRNQFSNVLRDSTVMYHDY